MSAIHSLYVHLPFCREICPFCGFAVLKDRREDKGFYLDLLEAEWRGLGETFAPRFGPLRSIYLGGGTPSRLSLAELERLLSFLPALPPGGQLSLEANPEDLSPEYAQGLARLGINRVSLGVQSHSDRHLEILGRAHRAEDNLRALEALERAGIQNLNLDLIFGYPGQTAQDLEAELAALLGWGPAHLSAYALTIEPKTKLARKPDWACWIEGNEAQVAQGYVRIIEACAQAGLAQYEVSNFARPGLESQQNLSNWDRENYLGLGLGAHGLVDGHRYSNWRRLKEYRLGLAGKGPRWDLDELLSPAQEREEEWLLGLRRPQGVEVRPEEESPALESAVRRGWAQRSGELLRLTPQGLLLADELTVQFLAGQT